jgi:hypothetical protein
MRCSNPLQVPFDLDGGRQGIRAWPHDRALRHSRSPGVRDCGAINRGPMRRHMQHTLAKELPEGCYCENSLLQTG